MVQRIVWNIVWAVPDLKEYPEECLEDKVVKYQYFSKSKVSQGKDDAVEGRRKD